jgi:hypothetical protein
MNCPRCSSLLDEDDARFCPYCGASLAEPSAPAASTAAASALPAADPSSAGEAAGPVAAPADALPRCARHPDRTTRQTCPRCGTFTCGECTRVTRTGDPICASCYERTGGGTQPIPWEQRSERGLLGGYIKTTAEVMLGPAELFSRSAPTTGRWWDPISYALLSGLIATLGYGALAFFTVAPDLDRLFGEKLDSAAGVAAFAVAGLAFLAFQAATLFIGSGLEHLMLMLVGARPRSYEATLRGYCYSYAPTFLMVLPVVGAWAFLLWQIVCRVLAYRGLHETTGGRATAAVLLPWAACCTLNVAIFAAISALR